MRTYDLTPLFRTSIGFDRMSRLLDAALQQDSAKSYPPYNIAKVDDDAYRISLAVAGFTQDDIGVVVQDNVLTISGRSESDDSEVEYLHRGIAGRAFERRFNLADHIRVTDAWTESGLLHVELIREIPEALRPRTIEIRSGANKELSAAK